MDRIVRSIATGLVLTAFLASAAVAEDRKAASAPAPSRPETVYLQLSGMG